MSQLNAGRWLIWKSEELILNHPFGLKLDTRPRGLLGVTKFMTIQERIIMVYLKKDLVLLKKSNTEHIPVL